ncbi:unnamed protein product [Paramecium octaurelia]|uniref:Uncharacterized protein n=1 Tax=Paramecium octaurelia TaxID=43137 RepID=A0A8S1XD92_PAROT|nr:unnamed protein product [Paramecium octaurelia]
MIFHFFSINQTFINLVFQDNQYDTLMKSYTQRNTQVKHRTLLLISLDKQIIITLRISQINLENISNFVISHGFGLYDIMLYDSLEIQINNGIINQQNHRFLGLHKYQSCQLKQVTAQYYSTTLNIGSSKRTNLQNLTFYQVQSYAFPIIAIDSIDYKLSIQTESIILQDISFVSLSKRASKLQYNIQEQHFKSLQFIRYNKNSRTFIIELPLLYDNIEELIFLQQ